MNMLLYFCLFLNIYATVYATVAYKTSVVNVCSCGINISIIKFGIVKHRIITSCTFSIFSIEGILLLFYNVVNNFAPSLSPNLE